MNNKFFKLFSFLVLFILSANTSANLITNGDFESGTLNSWSIINQISSFSPHQAVLYSNSAGSSFGGLGNLTPTYSGGQYGALARPGDNIDVGFSQSISVLSGVEITYSLDFAIRETQIPGDSRTSQTVSLALNGNVVDTFASGPGLNTLFSSFSGTFIPTTNTLLLSITSLRPLSFGTGWGQFFVDNVVVTQDSSSSVPEPISLILMGTGIVGLSLARRKRIN